MIMMMKKKKKKKKKKKTKKNMTSISLRVNVLEIIRKNSLLPIFFVLFLKRFTCLFPSSSIPLLFCVFVLPFVLSSRLLRNLTWHQLQELHPQLANSNWPISRR
eukprot:756038-Hanusia_phi.AAC.1